MRRRRKAFPRLKTPKCKPLVTKNWMRQRSTRRRQRKITLRPAPKRADLLDTSRKTLLTATAAVAVEDAACAGATVGDAFIALRSRQFLICSRKDSKAWCRLANTLAGR